MITKRLSDFSQIELLYHTRMEKDFSSNELRPLESLRDAWVRNAYECYGLFDENRIEGYAFFFRRGQDYLLDFFAIAPEHRDEGLGSIFLRQLMKLVKQADSLICEVEDPDAAQNGEDKEQRERRMSFYLRNGCRKTSLRSILFGVNYCILEMPLGREHTVDDLRRIYAGLYYSMLPERIFRTELRIC